ncbi:Origin of replication complex subunit 1A [Orchesella cincta]|uniref:Origin of replication complex subunit 1A n=1 Tax=Orchesella cincta TaxID=48709 RepID=A0A1D2M6K9_ORCCI|nr:Origin of replication complex subunit 1A [Orchesella cincta]
MRPRPRRPKLTSVNRHMCLTCDEDFCRSALYRHCQTTGHGKYCADSKFYTASSWKRHLSHCTKVHDEVLHQLSGGESGNGSYRAATSLRERLVIQSKTKGIFQKEGSADEQIFHSGGLRRLQGRCDLLWCSNVECPVLYHLSCLDPPLKEVPEGDWYCTGCEAQREAQHRGSSSPEQQVELAEVVVWRKQYVVAAAVSSMMASKGNQQREGTITARKTKIDDEVDK